MDDKKDIFDLYYRDCMDKADADFGRCKTDADTAYEGALTKAKEACTQASERAEAEYQADLEKAGAANSAGVDYCNEQFGPSGPQQVAHCLHRIREAYDSDLAEARSAKADKQAAADRTYATDCANAESKHAQAMLAAKEQLEFDRAHCELYLSTDA